MDDSYVPDMSRGKYEGEAWIYGNDEVIAVLKNMAYQLFSEKETNILMTDFIWLL